MDRNRGFDISGLRQQIEDLLEDFSGGGRRPQGGRGAGGDQPQHLTLNIVDSEGGFIVTAPLPGLAPEEIDISVRGQSLAIRAHQKPAGSDRLNYSRREWGLGPFQRTIELAAPVDAERAEASFRHGVVTITLPKADPNKTRVIPLQEEDSSGADETAETATEIPVEEAPVEVMPPIVEETAHKAEDAAIPSTTGAEITADAVPDGEVASELAEGEEPPTRFYMRPPRRRGGQSRAAREAAKQATAAEPAASEEPAVDAPGAE